MFGTEVQAKPFMCEGRTQSTVAAFWTVFTLLSGIEKLVNVNKRITFSLACFISLSFCVMLGDEELLELR